MIDGIVASSYNTMLGSEANMHAVTAAGRALYRLWPSLFRYVHAKRVAEPMSLAIGHAAAKVYMHAAVDMHPNKADAHPAAQPHFLLQALQCDAVLLTDCTHV